MSQASQEIARQYANAAVNKKNWGGIAINVLSEGLSGDGATDDTAKLQAIINKTIGEGRKTILFPHGSYYITSLTNADKVDFVGDNSKFVGGYSGTIGDLGGFTAFKAETEQQIVDLDANKADAVYVETELSLKAAQIAQKAEQAALNVQTARIDSFTLLASGSTTGDAELIDARVGTNGITYANAGGAIRGQIVEKISVVDGIIPRAKTANYVITESVTYGYYYESTAGARATASGSWWAQPIIPMLPNISLRKDGCQLAQYDANKTFISYVAYGTTSFTTASNCAFVGICANTSVNSAGLYENSKYTGNYVKGEQLITTSQIQDFNKDTVDVVSTDFIKRTLGKNLFDKNGIGTQIVKGYYVEYNTGIAGANPTSEYAIIPVTGGQAYAINSTNNIHIAFFSTGNYKQSSYISGVLNKSTFTTPANAVMMTVSIKTAVAATIQVEEGSVSTTYAEYQYGLAADVINNGSINREKLSSDLLSAIGTKTVNIGTGYEYTSILRAMKENSGKNVRFIVHSGVYNLVAEYESHYGSSYFVNYAGYLTSDHFDKGLYLDDGVSMVGIGNVEIIFNYSGGNTIVHNKFAPINTSQNNTIENINITIAEGICRYGIHDDFAYAEGTNIFKNCTFRGKSYLNTFMGSGFGKSNTYLIENCRFVNVGGINIAYHNNVGAGAKNKLIVKDCYCDGSIRGAQYGASSYVSEMLVSGCKATAISVVMTDDTGNNQPNIELVQWNNVIG